MGAASDSKRSRLRGPRSDPDGPRPGPEGPPVGRVPPSDAVGRRRLPPLAAEAQTAGDGAGPLERLDGVLLALALPQHALVAVVVLQVPAGTQAGSAVRIVSIAAAAP